jgi:hypothetical protein
MRWVFLLSTLSTPSPETIEACHEARGTAIYEGLGWTHYVEIFNACDVALLCSVATDIDPEPRYDVIVDPNQTGVVRIRWGSPAPYFSPSVSCEPARPAT